MIQDDWFQDFDW